MAAEMAGRGPPAHRTGVGRDRRERSWIAGKKAGAATGAAAADTGFRALVAEARRAYEAALEAQRGIDWARYGEEFRRLGEVLERLGLRSRSGSNRATRQVAEPTGRSTS